MVRFERSCVRADFQGQKGGGVHFQIPAIVQIRANFFQDLRAHAEGVANVLVHNQIQVAQAVFHVLVLQAVVFFGQGQKGLGK